MNKKRILLSGALLVLALAFSGRSFAMEQEQKIFEAKKYKFIAFISAIVNKNSERVASFINFDKLGSNLDFDAEYSINSRLPNLGFTPLAVAYSVKDNDNVVRELIKGGALIDIDAKDKNGLTPIHWLCKIGNDRSVQSILTSYAPDLTIKDNLGNTALHYACSKCKDKHTIKALFGLGMRWDERSSGWKSGKKEIIPSLAGVINKDNKTPLDLAMENEAFKGTEIIDFLLNEQIEEKNEQIKEKIKKGDTVGFIGLIEREKLDAKKIDDMRLLFLVVENNNLIMLKYLIERKGADMYIKYVNKDGSCGSNQQDLGLCMSNSNIFSHYLSRKKQNIEIIRYLLKQDEGKDIFISYKDGLGWTPIYHAFFYSSIEIVKLLIEKGGLNFKSHDKTPLIAKLEYEREIIKKTINKDAGQINAINDDGLTFLNEMCQLFLDYSNLGIVFDEKELKVLYDIVGFLLSKGADINEADNKGETPLLKLCKNSQFSIDMAKLLVQSGAKVSQECIENLNKNINGFEDLKSFLENTIKSYEIEQLPVEKDEK